MKPDKRFLNQSKKFWANVRTIGQERGYATRRNKTKNRPGRVKVHSLAQITTALKKAGLSTEHIIQDGIPTQLGKDLEDYFKYRAQVLNDYVEPRLMDAERAAKVFQELELKNPQAPVPINKQSGKKKKPQYFTGIINRIIESELEGLPCDYDPRALTTITQNNEPLRTLARRVDGCFPGTVDPIAIWEIKEYYYTTTFGSRIADGVYETLLDGLELEELRTSENIKVYHYMMVDAHYTWWDMGKSYLCRIIDMLCMGYVDEVLFGYEVVERLPDIISTWKTKYHNKFG